MKDEKKWIAVAGRLDMISFLYWIAIVNALFVLTVGLSALVTYIGMKMGLPFWGVRAVAVLTFSALVFVGGRTLKKAFDAKRCDLHIEIDGDRLILTRQGRLFAKISLQDEFELLTGPTEEMGLAFPTETGQLRVGCLHKTMAWKDGIQIAFQFELEPSDFIRLVGELGLEDAVERRTS